MSKSQTVYECRNTSCTLGSRQGPGLFTGGISAEQVSTMTGQPVDLVDAGDYGEGVCPNCGKRGKAVKA